MAVKSRTLTQEIAWRLAEVYAAQTHGDYDEETLFDRGGDWAADEVGKVLSERLGFPTEALEAGVVRELVEALEALVSEIEWEIGEEKWGRDPDALPMARAVLAKARFVEARTEDLDYMALEQERDTARAEAERWRKKYEALRAGVERVADDLHMAADEAHDNWRITADFNEQGRFIGLEEAEQMVRQLLAEAGGGDQ